MKIENVAVTYAPTPMRGHPATPRAPIPQPLYGRGSARPFLPTIKRRLEAYKSNKTNDTNVNVVDLEDDAPSCDMHSLKTMHAAISRV